MNIRSDGFRGSCQRFNVWASNIAQFGTLSLSSNRQRSSNNETCSNIDGSGRSACVRNACRFRSRCGPARGMGGGGGGHMSMGGGGHMAIGGGGFGGAGIRGGGMGPAFRAGPSVGVMPQRFSGTVGMAPQRFSAPARIRTAQASNGNRGYWDRDRRHFRRGAFFGFAAAYPWWDYGYSDSC